MTGFVGISGLKIDKTGALFSDSARGKKTVESAKVSNLFHLSGMSVVCDLRGASPVSYCKY